MLLGTLKVLEQVLLFLYMSLGMSLLFCNIYESAAFTFYISENPKEKKLLKEFYEKGLFYRAQ